MASSVSLIDRIQSAPQRELYFFSLYRVLVAGLIAALVFSPLSDAIPEPRYPRLAAGVAIGYLSMAIPLLFWGRSERRLTATVLCAVLADILAATLATHALPGASDGIAMMLLFNVAAGSILLRLRYGMSVAVVASTAIVLEYLWTLLEGGTTRPVAELAMFATSYVAVAYICQQIASRARSNQALAEQRGAQVANLYEINELIIRRMRTGVLVVDTHNRITLANEAALALLGDGDQRNAPADLALAALTPELARRLQRWRSGWRQEESPLQLGADRPEVQPRFVRLLADSDLVLIFLDDASVVSRRAESLTLSAMGRFSASLAHEIRNRWRPSTTPRSCWKNRRTSAMPTAACCRSSTSNASAPTASSKACSAWPGASAPARKTWTWPRSCAASSWNTGRPCRWRPTSWKPASRAPRCTP